MALRLMYITNSPEVSLIAEKAGVDRIYVDLEHIGKADRQGGMNTVQSKHTIEDIKSVRSVITKSDLLVRCNSIANLERYGYDFETDSRVTNEMILEQRGISEEEYLENLRETARSKFETAHSGIPADILETSDYAELMERTMEWQTLDEPMFIDQYGEIETIALIGAMAGAGRYYRLVTPFVHQINIVGDSDLVESCPETAHVGETVTVSLYDVTDGDMEISADGVDGTRVGWMGYQFVMPAHDVDVHVEFISNGLA